MQKPFFLRRFFVLLLGATTLGVGASSPGHAAAYPRTDLTDRVDALFAEWDRPDSPGAALGIIQDGRLVYARGYGMANLEYDIPITPQNVFRTGSVGKQFTAMCIAILVESGRLSLDDDIREHLPEMPEYEEPITIRHLIHHTGGMRSYLWLQDLAGRIDDYYFTTEEAIALLARQQALNFLPGEKYEYSNSGYFLLGEIAARVSGMSLREFARKRIFEPLGMKNSHFHDDRNMVVRNRATGYKPLDDGRFRIATTQLEIVGDGSVFTTIEDFLLWDRNFYDNKLGRGSPDLIETVLTPGLTDDGTSTGYAFGLHIDSYRGLRRVWHTGSYSGYRALYDRFPEMHFSIIVFGNVSTLTYTKRYRLANSITDIYLDAHFTEPAPTADRQSDGAPRKKKPRAIRISTAILAQYEADYYSDELEATARIRIDGHRLTMTVFRAFDRLTPIAEDTFLAPYDDVDTDEAGGSILEFQRDGGAVIGFLMHADPIRDIGFTRVVRDAAP